MRFSPFSRGLALALAGCSLFNDPSVCTTEGCDSGLWLDFVSMPVGAYRVEVGVQSGYGQPVYTFECGAQCPASAWFPGLIIERGYVRVTTSTGTLVKEIRPVYETRRPNGPNCPGVCDVAVLTVQL